MNSFAHLVLFGWIPLVLALFFSLRPRIAFLVAMTAGTLFLPVLSIDVPGPVNVGKQEVLCIAVLLGVVLRNPARLREFRLRLVDLPMLLWIAAAPVASLANDLGSYDALASILNRFITWGIPYLLGSVYLSSREGARDLLWVLFLSGLAYVPLCLYEVRMSPQLHAMVYGSSQHSFAQTVRGGGFRPMVFTSHGLELSLWMAAATIAGVTLWRARPAPRIFGQPLLPFLAAVALTTILCKSTGAILLGAVGVALVSPWAQRWLHLAILLSVPAYLSVRFFGGGSLESLLVSMSGWVSEDRAGSLQFRFDNEEVFLKKAAESPLLGHGGWDFGLIFDPETGEAIPVVTDSFWIIAVATNGLLGLLGFLGSLWLPAVRGFVVPRLRPQDRLIEVIAPATILTILVIDSMVNAFIPPIYIAIAGGLAHLNLSTAGHPTAAAEEPRSATPIPSGQAPNRRRRNWLEPRPRT